MAASCSPNVVEESFPMKRELKGRSSHSEMLQTEVEESFPMKRELKGPKRPRRKPQKTR